MTSKDDTRIKTILTEFTFSDASNASSRASDIVVTGGNVGFSLDITGIELPEAELVREGVIKKLKEENIGKISIVLTSSRPEQKSEKPKIHIDGVKKIILVASGKGGVGKSTISALLAHKLTSQGKKVGIVDADIYGPSIPNILGVFGKPDLEDSKMIPLMNHGIVVNSIGFLTAPGASISWRGPMVSKALYQLLSLTKWENLDYLIIDTPPGTGDIHLSLLQNYIIDKLYMVTTPQKISEIDVNRAINLYKKFNVPVAGVIENMSYFIDKDSGKRISLFSGNAGSSIAAKYDIPFLAQIPLDPKLSEACDSGESLIQFTNLIESL